VYEGIQFYFILVFVFKDAVSCAKAGIIDGFSCVQCFILTSDIV